MLILLQPINQAISGESNNACYVHNDVNTGLVSPLVNQLAKVIICQEQKFSEIIPIAFSYEVRAQKNRNKPCFFPKMKTNFLFLNT